MKLGFWHEEHEVQDLARELAPNRFFRVQQAALRIRAGNIELSPHYLLSGLYNFDVDKLLAVVIGHNGARYDVLVVKQVKERILCPGGQWEGGGSRGGGGLAGERV